MPALSTEVKLLEAARDWLAGLDVFATWTGLTVDSAELKARVVWPFEAAITLPTITLSHRGSRRVNLTGAASGGNWQPSGVLTFDVWAADTDPTDLQASYETFADLFYQLLDEMASEAATAPRLFNSIELEDPPVMHSPKGDADDPWWVGTGHVDWGTASL